MDIKPIETVYNGYRFRSRLEARWAVFFDELGIKYEYEPEGFDLGDLGYYLPDFWLPEQKLMIEIKPKETGKNAKKIYLAGKIWKNDWRHDIAFMRDANQNEQAEIATWNYYAECRESEHLITGPFFVSCDHGCGHGKNTHGCGETCCSGSISHSPIGRQIAVQRECFSAIRMSTDIFVWISSLDCYGTLVEAGYAAALGIPVHTAIQKNLQEEIVSEKGCDLWFLSNLSHEFHYCENAKEAFDSYFPPNKTLLKIEKAGNAKRGSGVLCSGDPLDHIRTGAGSAMFNFSISKPNRERAAIAARQARFEHGQVGSPKRWAI